MIRDARSEDLNVIWQFLDAHAAESMFLRSNLSDHGLFDRNSPYGTTFHLYEQANMIRGVFGRTNGGYLICQYPDGDQAVWDAFAQTVIDHPLIGMTGAVAQVNHALTALGIVPNRLGLNREEPFYELSLDQLPPCDAKVRPPVKSDVPLLTQWFQAFLVETGFETESPQRVQAARDRAEKAVTHGTSRLLLVDDQPVAMVGLNARAKNTVQIGGVYTPPEHRGKGYAGLCLAAYLHELSQDGIDLAVLFAASQAAAKAYEAIGFEYKRMFKVAMLAEREIYRGPA